MTTRTLLLALAAAPALLAATACNTVEGAGEDLQSASREVKEEI
jgi:predicted small secreted protein